MAGGGGGSGSGSSLGGGLRCAMAGGLSSATANTTSSQGRIATILLEVKNHLALGGRWREAALLIVREDCVDHLLRRVAHLHEIEIGRIDHAFAGQALAHPRKQAAPVRLVHQ